MVKATAYTCLMIVWSTLIWISIECLPTTTGSTSTASSLNTESTTAAAYSTPSTYISTTTPKSSTISFFSTSSFIPSSEASLSTNTVTNINTYTTSTDFKGTTSKSSTETAISSTPVSTEEASTSVEPLTLNLDTQSATSMTGTSTENPTTLSTSTASSTQTSSNSTTVSVSTTGTSAATDTTISTSNTSTGQTLSGTTQSSSSTPLRSSTESISESTRLDFTSTDKPPTTRSGTSPQSTTSTFYVNIGLPSLQTVKGELSFTAPVWLPGSILKALPKQAFHNGFKGKGDVKSTFGTTMASTTTTLEKPHAAQKQEGQVLVCYEGKCFTKGCLEEETTKKHFAKCTTNGSCFVKYFRNSTYAYFEAGCEFIGCKDYDKACHSGREQQVCCNKTKCNNDHSLLNKFVVSKTSSVTTLSNYLTLIFAAVVHTFVLHVHVFMY